jgi:hypothetical protein
LQKTAVKIHHAEKTLQLFDVLRGWAKFYFGGMIGRGGRPCRRKNIVWILDIGMDSDVDIGTLPIPE